MKSQSRSSSESLDFVLDQTDISTDIACPLFFNVIQVAVASLKSG